MQQMCEQRSCLHLLAHFEYFLALHCIPFPTVTKKTNFTTAVVLFKCILYIINTDTWYISISCKSTHLNCTKNATKHHFYNHPYLGNCLILWDIMGLLVVCTLSLMIQYFIAMLMHSIGFCQLVTQIAAHYQCDSFNISWSCMKTAFSLSILRLWGLGLCKGIRQGSCEMHCANFT